MLYLWNHTLGCYAIANSVFEAYVILVCQKYHWVW